jgi:hypothetical protein
MTDDRGTVKENGSMHDRRFWTQKGVIPRWQLLLVYVMVVGVAAAGLWRTSVVADDANALARRVQEDREAAIRTSCEQQNERNTDMVALLFKLNPKLEPKVAHRFADAGWPRYDCDQRVKDLSKG